MPEVKRNRPAGAGDYDPAATNGTINLLNFETAWRPRPLSVPGSAGGSPSGVAFGFLGGLQPGGYVPQLFTLCCVLGSGVSSRLQGSMGCMLQFDKSLSTSARKPSSDRQQRHFRSAQHSSAQSEGLMLTFAACASNQVLPAALTT